MININASSSSSPSLAFPDMTALLDVIFILLVFLLLTANVAPRALEVSLPEEGSESSELLNIDEPITITLFDDADHWALGKQEYRNWIAFETALAAKVAAMENPQVVLAGDKDVSLQQLLKLFSWLQRHDLKAAQVLMQTDEDAGGVDQ